MKVNKVLSSVAVAAVLSTAAPAYAADVIIGVPNWPSVRVTAHVLKVVLEDNLGLEVELQNGTNPVVFEAMDSGSMHVHPEVWLPNQSNLNNKFVNERKSVMVNPNGVAGDQAMCVTKGTAERTGITELSDLTNPDMAKNFDTDGDGKGEIWIGAAGWASTNVEKVRAKSYGYSETMQLKEMDETLALAEVDNAVAQKKDIVFFCYTPHHMFALHDLVILKEPKHDAAKWNVLQPTDDPEWLEKSDAAVAWNTAYLHIHYAAKLEEEQPAAAEVLKNVKLDTDTVSAMTYALVVEKQDPEAYAKKWVSENGALVDSWLN
ncbi:glycine betaine ABC transporter substrate-binding protein [Denitrobaculum tricleocarpae]|uniref:Amino acid-binding protein n=1 Tax=Denitrobaculum tricleocarpae TaxID=2591009 RepID=A0A545U0X9_9PROT|nr:glycine betaine ABC transporter substrate-binding protein [Denitrobaculum tricleocarpae]TQV83063.1 amino acid-binding protein [Denitrobaculum tricleocarpae]